MVFSHFIRPRWLFFDLDDTIWNFKRNSLESLNHIFNIFEEIYTEFSSFEEFLDMYHLNNSALWKDFADGKISSASLKSERWRRTLFPESDPLSPPEICQTIDKEYLSFLACQPNLVEGAQEILQSLSTDHMIAVLSNGFIDTQYRKLKHSGLWRYISRTVVSDEAGYQKPDPRIYKYAVEATGASDVPVMIGDNPDTDILGALRAGWKAIWFNPAGKEFPWSTEELKETGANPENFMGSAATLNEVEKIIRSM